jgi:hypothetical protein
MWRCEIGLVKEMIKYILKFIYFSIHYHTLLIINTKYHQNNLIIEI